MLLLLLILLSLSICTDERRRIGALLLLAPDSSFIGRWVFETDRGKSVALCCVDGGVGDGGDAGRCCCC